MQSDIWSKIGRAGPPRDEYDNNEQRIHCDYPNHMLVHPSPWHKPDGVEIIVYYSDCDECGGATRVGKYA